MVCRIHGKCVLRPHAGYKSGDVKLWDASSEQPGLLLVAPAAGAYETRFEGGGSSLRAVTAVDVAPEHGIVCSGHAKGEVRLEDEEP